MKNETVLILVVIGMIYFTSTQKSFNVIKNSDNKNINNLYYHVSKLDTDIKNYESKVLKTVDKQHKEIDYLINFLYKYG